MGTDWKGWGACHQMSGEECSRGRAQPVQRPRAPGTENSWVREAGECGRCSQRPLEPIGAHRLWQGGGALGREGRALGCVLCDGAERRGAGREGGGLDRSRSQRGLPESSRYVPMVAWTTVMHRSVGECLFHERDKLARVLGA